MKNQLIPILRCASDITASDNDLISDVVSPRTVRGIVKPVCNTGAAEDFELLLGSRHLLISFVSSGGYPAIREGCVTIIDTGLFNDADDNVSGFFFVSIMIDSTTQGKPEGTDIALSGVDTGWIVDWSPQTGLRGLPNSESPFNNELELIHVQNSILFNAWAAKQLRVYDRGQNRIINTVDLLFYPDNIIPHADAKLIITGIDELEGWKVCHKEEVVFCNSAITVVAIDPAKLEVETPFHAESGLISGASAALRRDAKILCMSTGTQTSAC